MLIYFVSVQHGMHIMLTLNTVISLANELLSHTFFLPFPSQRSCQERQCTEKCYPLLLHMSPFYSLIYSLANCTHFKTSKVSVEKRNKNTSTWLMAEMPSLAVFFSLSFMLMVLSFFYLMVKYSVIWKEISQIIWLFIDRFFFFLNSLHFWNFLSHFGQT